MGQSGTLERAPIGSSLSGGSRVQLTWSVVYDGASLRAAARVGPYCQSEQRGSEWQVYFKHVAGTLRAGKQEELVVKKMDPKPSCLASNPGSGIYVLCQFGQMA